MFGLADVAKLAVDLSLTGNFTRSLGQAQKQLGSFDKLVDSTQGRAYKAGTQIGTGIKRGAAIAAGAIGLLGSQVLFGLRQLAELEKQTAQTNAVLKSTGGVAGQTAKSVRDLAEKYENLNAIIDDKVIQSGENLLLTFTNVRKNAFEPTLAAALDMSTALGQDLNTSVLQLGKALSDPAKGLLALRRAGVIFSKDQEKRIKALQKEGKLYDAQKIILAEVAREFGGSFAAQGKTAEGAIAGIGDAVEDLQKALATALFPTIQKVLPKIREFLTSPALQQGITDLGKGIAGLFSDENIKAGTDILKSVFASAKAAAPVVAAAAKTMAGIVQTAVSVFRSLPPEIQQLAVGAFAVNKLTGGLVTNIGGAVASGLGSFLAKQFAGAIGIKAAIVNVNGPVVGGGGGPGSPAPTGGGITGIVKDGLEAGFKLAIPAVIGGVVGGVIAHTASGVIDPKLQGAIDNGATPLANRDPRRFNQNGQVTTNLAPVTKKLDEVKGQISQGDVRSAERLEAIRAATAAQSAKADALNASVAQVTANDSIQAALTRAKIGDGTAEAARMKAALTSGIADTRSETARTTAAVTAAKAANQQSAAAIRDKVGTSGSLIKSSVDAAKGVMASVRAAAAAAGQQTSAAIRAKDLSVHINNYNNLRVSIRDVTDAQIYAKSYNKVIS